MRRKEAPPRGGGLTVVVTKGRKKYTLCLVKSRRVAKGKGRVLALLRCMQKTKVVCVEEFVRGYYPLPVKRQGAGVFFVIDCVLPTPGVRFSSFAILQQRW